MAKDLPPAYSEAISETRREEPPPDYEEIETNRNVYARRAFLQPESPTRGSVPIFGRHPQHVRCPYCAQQSVSRVVRTPHEGTHAIAALLCLLGCIPFCLIPYCISDFQDLTHFCPRCSAYLEYARTSSVVTVRRRFRAQFNSSVRKWYETFRDERCLCIHRPRRPGPNHDTVDRVRAVCKRSPQKSIKGGSLQPAMQKDLPPPYSEATAPNVGFNLPPNPAQPPPPPGYVGQMPTSHVYAGQPGASIVVTNVPVMVQTFGPHPQPVTCPSCHQPTTTRVLSEPSTKTHLLALLLCFVGCVPCCLLPYCLDTCQNQNHYCSNCSTYLGVYNDATIYQRRGYW